MIVMLLRVPKHATGLSVDDEFSPVGWQVHHISRLHNAAEALHIGILRPLSKVWVFQVHHGVAIIGVVHRVGVHAIEGVVSRNQQKALAACHLSHGHPVGLTIMTRRHCHVST